MSCQHCLAFLCLFFCLKIFDVVTETLVDTCEALLVNLHPRSAFWTNVQRSQIHDPLSALETPIPSGQMALLSLEALCAYGFPISFMGDFQISLSAQGKTWNTL